MLRSRIGVLVARSSSLLGADGARKPRVLRTAVRLCQSRSRSPATRCDRARLDDRGGEPCVELLARHAPATGARARAAARPRLLLLDEPFTGLDDASTAALVGRLRELRSQGCITLVATHDFEVAEAVVNRVVILQDGRLVSSESDVRGLRSRYQQRLTAPDGRIMNAFWRVVWIVARKDLAIEARSRELINTTVFFAVSCVVVFSVSFVGEGGDGRAIGDAAAGILWIAIAFSGTLALGPDVRARALRRYAARVAAGAGRARGGLRRQAPGHRRRC